VRGINNLLKLGVCASRNQVVAHLTAEDDAERVRVRFLHSPKKSIGTAAKELSMSKTTVRRVLRKRLVFTLYRIQMVKQLSNEDHRRRLDFCLQLQDLMSSDYHFLGKVQFSDEATFHVSGAVNRRNVRIWVSETPHAYVEHQHDSPKVNVFCAISSHKAYGPFFFAEETVTGITCLDMLQL
jgi:IS30 family transposase